jgi:hypothetical protein
MIRNAYQHIRSWIRLLERAILRPRYMDRDAFLSRYADQILYFGEAESPIRDFPKYRMHLQHKHRHGLEQMPYWHEKLTRLNFTFPPPFVGIIENARLVTSKNIPITAKGDILLETNANLGKFLERQLLETQLLRSSFQSTDETLEFALPLTSGYSDNFYHWMTECLPLALYYFDVQERLNLQPTLLIDRDAPSFQRESLRALGIPEANIAVSRGSNTFVKRLIVPGARHHHWQSSFNLNAPDTLRRLRKRMLAELSLTGSEPNRLYIARKTTARSIANEQKLLEILNPMGFERVYLDDYPLSDQIRMVNQAEWIIAAHGAAFANLLYADRATVIELFPHNRFLRDAIYFYQIAAAADIPWHTIICAASDDQQRLRVDQDVLSVISQLVEAKT